MKNIVSVLCLVLSMTSYAELAPFVLKDAQIMFKEGGGTVTASKFKYDLDGVKLNKSPFKGKLIMSKENLAFVVDGTVIEVPQLNFILAAAERVVLKNGNIVTKGNSLSATADYVFTKAGDNETTIERLNLKCSGKESKYQTEHFKIFDTCIQRGLSELRISRIKMDPPVGFHEIKDGVLKVSHTQYDLNGKARKGMLQVKGKVNGSLLYNESKERLELKFNHAKVGGLDLKGLVFNTLEEKSYGNLEVDRPYIYYYIPKDTHLNITVLISNK